MCVTLQRFFFIGSDASEREFRILKIDRTVVRALSLVEDSVVYSKEEIKEFLQMMDDGNKSTGGLKRVTSLFGIAGFVHFLEGYYVYIITKASIIAVIGGHFIYKIDEAQLVSITPANKIDRQPDEARYIDMFSSVDLTRNFYFSYTYDLTHSLQHNLTSDQNCGNELNDMFVWNYYLLRVGFTAVTRTAPWTLPLIYGFLLQSRLVVAGRTIFITLIARRSRHFAGARFLKRGINDDGYVANDVETEQIVHDAFFAYRENDKAAYTSYVQHRGSIPLFWSQENTNLAPKPPIRINILDPFYTATALHFENMFERYAAPVIVLNLVKHKESTKRESLLLDEYTSAIKYLNQFLPEDKKINYIAFDMSRAAKSSDTDVLGLLEQIAEKTLSKTNFFHSKAEPYMHLLTSPDKEYRGKPVLQSGVVRTNCIDCLDRTNAAQFILGKVALSNQLYALGLIDTPKLSMDCGATKLLMQMYHDHGDIIALQYGGSALVNTMESYRKTNAWSSQSRDMIETIKRYYNNSFTDAEKQDAINLFLGNFVSREDMPTIWELSTDYYLHNDDPREKRQAKNYRQWFREDLFSKEEGSEDKKINVENVSVPFSLFYDVGRYTSFKDHFMFYGLDDQAESSPDPFYSPFKTESSTSSNSTSIENSHDISRKKAHSFAGSPAIQPAYQRTTVLSTTGTINEKKGRGPLSTSALAQKSLEPSVSPEELAEYERYVSQTSSDFFLKSDNNSDQYNKNFYEEYISNAKNLVFIHDAKDQAIYEKHVNAAKSISAFEPIPTKTQEAYKRWLETGKYVQ